LGWGALWGPPPSPRPALHSNGVTSLHWAAYYGNRRIVRKLLDANANVNAPTKEG
jgi:ankyrin repeat protein